MWRGGYEEGWVCGGGRYEEGVGMRGGYEEGWGRVSWGWVYVIPVRIRM